MLESFFTSRGMQTVAICLFLAMMPTASAFSLAGPIARRTFPTASSFMSSSGPRLARAGLAAPLRMSSGSDDNDSQGVKEHQQAATDVQMMPIGVPKVAYRVPGAPSADWVDIYNRLYRERIIFLGQEIDDEIANQIIAVMLYLDSEDNSKPIYLYINSPGGSVISGLALYDTMRHIKSEVVTINVGLAASMASFILAAGEKGKRLALPHSRIMIHQPMGGAQGQASDIKVEAQQILRIRKSLVEDYAQMTGRPYEKVLQDMDRDNFMSAHQGVEYGLIDRVIESNIG